MPVMACKARSTIDIFQNPVITDFWININAERRSSVNTLMAEAALNKNSYQERRYRRSSRFKPSVIHSHEEGLTGKVARLTGETIEEISRPKDKYKLQEYRLMLESSPEAKACIELKALRARASLGDYTHPNKDIQEFVRENIEGMRGSIGDVVHQMASALPLGFSVAEIVYTNRSPGHRFQWRLDTINPLEPERISFAGKRGDIKYVVYTNQRRGKKFVDYARCIHVVNGITFGEPFGSPEARRAMPLFKAMQLILSEMAVAGKNNASGILLAQADSNKKVRVLDSRGNPMREGSREKTMTGPEALLLQMKGIESSGIVATDLENKITPLPMPSAESFWMNSTNILKKGIFLAFMVPSLIWDEGSGGLGNSGISGNHLAILDSNIDAIVRQIQDQLVEKLARNLIQWQFGWQRNWGKFERQPHTDPAAQMGRAASLLSAISTQVIPSTDLDAINRLREDLGISPITHEDMFAMRQMQASLQQMTAAPAEPVAAA